MIKFQDQNQDNHNSGTNRIKDQNICVCLSPFCFQPFNRIFHIDVHLQQQQHSNFNQYVHDKPQCESWKISLQQLRSQILPLKPKQLQNLQINFQSDPLDALKKIMRLQKTKWQKQLNKQIEKIKKEVNKSLDQLAESIQAKMKNILQKGQFYKDLVEMINKGIDLKSTKFNQNQIQRQSRHQYQNAIYLNLSQQLSQYLHKNQQIISQLKTVTFLNKVQLKTELQNIRKGIDAMQSKLIVQKLGKKERNSQKLQFYQWMFKKQENVFNKLQLIASLFSMAPKSYHIQGDFIQLNCFLCEKFVRQPIKHTNTKQLKKFMAQQIVIHIYNDHHDRVFFSFLKKIAKLKTSQIKLNDLFQLMRKYNEVHVIDRQTGVKYTEDFVSNEIFAVQLLTAKNVKLAQGKYVILDSRQGVNSLISILIRQCSTQGKKIMVVSKKTEQVNQIYKMLELCKDQGECKVEFDGIDYNFQNSGLAKLQSVKINSSKKQQKQK